MPTLVRSPKRVSKSRPVQFRRLEDSLYRISLTQYHEMIRRGILTADDRVELLEGCLVKKMAKNPPHAAVSEALREILPTLLPSGWCLRSQNPITVPESDSEPEPDIVVVQGKWRTFIERHPQPEEFGIAIEVSDTSLRHDRGWKRRIYERARIETYWIVNLVDRTLEVFTDLSDSGTPTYQKHDVYSERQRVPIVLHGKKVATLLVSDVLP